MSIWTGHEWTEADSEALDVWAASNPNRRPLTADPVLWELLTPLRDTVPVGWLPSCSMCDQPMRPSRENADGYPGTVRQYASSDHCQSCYMRHRNGGEKRDRRPMCCLQCERPMRSSRVRAEDAPGTVRFRSKGLCETCSKSKKVAA